MKRVTVLLGALSALLALTLALVLFGRPEAPDAPQRTPYLYGVTDEWVECVREAGSTATDLSDPEALRHAVAKSLEFDYCTQHLG